MRIRHLYFYAAYEPSHRLDEFQPAHRPHRRGEPAALDAGALLQPAIDRTTNTPLANIYVLLLQRLGIGSEKFATSNGMMRGLEMGSAEHHAFYAQNKAVTTG